MTRESEYKLKSLSEVSFFAQLKWSIGFLAKWLGVSKKELREIYKIKMMPELVDEVVEKNKKVKRKYQFGFHSFDKKEKNKVRRILAPHPRLQRVFKIIKELSEKAGIVHPNAFGFVAKRDPKKAVQELLGQKHFFSFDIADAFPSITQAMVETALDRMGVVEVLIRPLAWLATHFYELKSRLPQGSSCSPVLLNIVYSPMCREIDLVCKRHSIKWIVYADDFNFAADEISWEAKRDLLAIPAKYGFQVKPQKTRDNLGKTIPHLLGLTIVGGNIHLRRRTKKKFRRILWMAAKGKGAYSPRCAIGIARHIDYIYGEQANWPGWLEKAWIEYRKRMEAENGQ